MTGGREGQVAVTMPQLGETVAEGTVLRWLKQVGDAVADQEPLLEISTDKVDAEVPSPAGGVLAEIVVGEDETVDVGTILAHVAPGAGSTGAGSTGPRAEAPGAPPAVPTAEGRSPSPPNGERSSPTASGASSPAAPAASSPEDAAALQDGTAHQPQPRPGPRHRHSPRVRRLAHDSGIDLASLSGTGPGGRVTPGDVAGASSGVADSVPRVGATSPVPPGQVFSTIVVEVEVRSSQWVTASEVAPHSAPGPAAATFVAAVAGALRGHPAVLAPGAVGTAGDLAVSWSTDAGTVTSRLSEAAELNIGGVAQRLLAGATAELDLAGTGFAVSFLPDGDVLFEVAAPLPGHVATMAFGAPTERVVVVPTGGSPGIAIRPRSYLALSYDPATVPRKAALAFIRDVVRRATSHT